MTIAWGQVWPSPEEFATLARSTRVIPVMTRLLADDATPVGIYRRIAAGTPGTFILESAEVDGTWSRYSFIGAASRATLTTRRRNDEVDPPGLNTPVATWLGEVPAGLPMDTDPLAVLGSALAALHSPLDTSSSAGAEGDTPGDTTPPVTIPAGIPPLTGGFVGTIGWDAVRRWEPSLPANAPQEIPAPEVALVLATDLVVVDHVDGSVWLIANAINFDGAETGVAAAYADASARLESLRARIAQPAPPHLGELGPNAEPELRFRTTREEFEAMVVAGKEAIGAGEVFQVVLSQRLDLDCPADPFDVYRVLRTINPSPYMYFFHLQDEDGEFFVVGSSPETLVKVTGSQVLTYPIAGSRPRGATPEADAALVTELLADPKERAEHIMLVDLSRNDLLKVCDPASVDVVEFMAIKKFSHVMHITSTVTGTLAPEMTALDTLRAAFPAGTLSGAPKNRAIELIDELEPARRGIYGGTVGYFDFAGNMDMAIAIRTALIRDQVASVQAGGGVVADSVPALEYEESRNKAAAAVRAVQIAARLS